jgi:hydroxyethylthiazole kinase-like uncharacterized protein yjeF
VKVAKADEMRAIDAAAVERGLPSIVLMENAAIAVARAVAGVASELGGTPQIVVVAGKGNNGGDGLAAARHLRNQGYDVTVALTCAGEELAGDAAINFAAAKGYEVEITENCGAEALGEILAGADIVVDAVLGTGIRGEVRGAAREAIEAINASGAAVVAVDIPSGIDADTGAVCGVAVRANVTVTFGLPKVGNVVYPGAGYCGELRIADISLPPERLRDASIRTNLITPELASACLPTRWADMHKGDAGRVLVVAGSRGYTGAAALAGMGALRAGAGLVYLAVPKSLNEVMEVKCTEAITLPMAETEAGSLSVEAAEQIVAFAENCDAVAVGPGMSRHPDTARLVREVVARVTKPLVVDADGLTCLADIGAGQLAMREGPTIITPHPGELARLIGMRVEDIQADRLGAARKTAESFNAVAVLKGAGTIVAEPGGTCWINTTGSSGMASGGTGDVLTGIVAALLAGGAAAEEAAIAAVYYHGRAGELAAEQSGERALIASDLLSVLGKTFPA